MIIILQLLTVVIGIIITIPLFLLSFKLFISDFRNELFFDDSIEQLDTFIKSEILIDTKNNKLISKRVLTPYAINRILS